MSVGLFARVSSKTTRPNFTKFSVRVLHDCGSILIWRQCNTLCISGSVDDVRFHIMAQIQIWACDVANYLPWLARWRHWLTSATSMWRRTMHCAPDGEVSLLSSTAWWPPCVADADIIFVLWLIMVDHYIFIMWFLLSFFFFFFPRVISAVGDWMSAILPHVVWP